MQSMLISEQRRKNFHGHSLSNQAGGAISGLPRTQPPRIPRNTASGNYMPIAASHFS